MERLRICLLFAPLGGNEMRCLFFPSAPRREEAICALVSSHHLIISSLHFSSHFSFSQIILYHHPSLPPLHSILIIKKIISSQGHKICMCPNCRDPACPVPGPNHQQGLLRFLQRTGDKNEVHKIVHPAQNSVSPLSGKAAWQLPGGFYVTSHYFRYQVFHFCSRRIL